MEEMFRYYMEFYNGILQNINRYYKFSSKMFEKIMESYNQCPQAQKTKVEKGSFRANGHDIYNYVARYGMSNLQIQAILRFDGKLDFEKLKRAVKLSVETEPVLKSRLIEDEPPRWEPLDNMGMIDFCTLQEVDDIDSAVQNFIEDKMNMDKDPLLNVRLIRTEQYDVLAVKINHTCCDGCGTQEYVRLLSDIYNVIDQEGGKYEPVPRIGGREDQDRLFKELGITDIDSLFTPGSDLFNPMWSFPWEPCSSNTACMSVCRLHAGFVDEMKEYAKSKRATVNDLILTACYRAMLEMKQPIYGLPMEIPITVDLRRYLSDHKTSAIRNFSGSVGTKLDMIVDEPFESTLQRVTEMTKEIKKGYPGLQSAIGLERIEKISFHEILSYYHAIPETKNTEYFCPLYSGDRCVPTLSNVGYLSKEIIRFGDETVADAYILPPVIRAPGLLLMASTYNSVLTLATGYYKGTVGKENIDRLLNKIKDELIEGCK